jgi:hypothetical protein
VFEIGTQETAAILASYLKSEWRSAAAMANRFPNVAFTGIEITKGQIDQRRARLRPFCARPDVKSGLGLIPTIQVLHKIRASAFRHPSPGARAGHYAYGVRGGCRAGIVDCATSPMRGRRAVVG